MDQTGLCSCSPFFFSPDFLCLLVRDGLLIWTANRFEDANSYKGLERGGGEVKIEEGSKFFLGREDVVLQTILEIG